MATGLIVGCVPLIVLAIVAVFVLPVVHCPACIGWRLNEIRLGIRSIRQISEGCRYCKGSGKVTFIRDWLMTRKEGRPCYYMTHDE